MKKMTHVSGFKGVYPCDLLPTEARGLAGFIVNTDPHYMEGAHWVAVLILQDGKGEYFDSFGRPPQIEIDRFLMRNCPKGYSIVTVPLQSRSQDSTVCGNYTLLYLAMRLKGYSTHSFLSLFTRHNTQINDALIHIFT